MSDLRGGEPVAAWLELELTRQLGVVAAPESLWSRVEQQRAPRARESFRWGYWPVAAALMLLAAGGAAYRMGIGSTVGIDKLAMSELREVASGAGRLDLRSEDPVEIRNWVKARADIDVELPARSPAYGGAIRLLGVRLIARPGGPVAVVAYRAGDGTATLLVSRDSSARGGGMAPAPHLFTHEESEQGARLFSWRMREQAYTIASSATTGPEVACLLCHAQPRAILN